MPRASGAQIRDPDARDLVRQQPGGGNLSLSALDFRCRVWVPDLRPDRCASGHPPALAKARVRHDKGLMVLDNMCQRAPRPCPECLAGIGPEWIYAVKGRFAAARGFALDRVNPLRQAACKSFRDSSAAGASDTGFTFCFEPSRIYPTSPRTNWRCLWDIRSSPPGSSSG